MVGAAVGSMVGSTDGSAVGSMVGSVVGCMVGIVVGSNHFGDIDTLQRETAVITDNKDKHKLRF